MQNILESAIQSMKDTLDTMDFNNIEEKKRELERYVTILDTLKEVNQLDPAKSFEIRKKDFSDYPEEEKEEEEETYEDEGSVLDEEETQKIETVDIEIDTISEEKEVIDEIASVFDKQKESKGYPFERKLLGGFLIKGTPSENIFVPEKIIRELDLREGDLVSAEMQSGGTRYSPNYYYKVEERNTEPTNGLRVEFNYGIVRYDESSHRFIVSENMNKENLRLEDGTIMTYMVKEKEADKYRLVDGDIVDIAWYKNNFDKARVSWKHPIDDVREKKTDAARMLNHKKENGKTETRKKEPVEQTLKGKSICLIGLEPYWEKYRKLVEERGGTIDTVESSRHKISISAAIRKVDLVVVGISHTSHEASVYANKRAKHYKTKFTAISGYGGESFINKIEETFGVN